MKPPPDDLHDLRGQWFFVTVLAHDGNAHAHPDTLRLAGYVYMRMGLILVFDHGQGTIAITYDWKWIVAMTPEKVSIKA